MDCSSCLDRLGFPAGYPGQLVPVGRARLNPGSDQGMYDVSADWKYVDRGRACDTITHLASVVSLRNAYQ